MITKVQEVFKPEIQYIQREDGGAHAYSVKLYETVVNGRVAGHSAEATNLWLRRPKKIHTYRPPKRGVGAITRPDGYIEIKRTQFSRIAAAQDRLAAKNFEVNTRRVKYRRKKGRTRIVGDNPIQELGKLGHDWEIVYIIANGPSLSENWKALKNRKRGVTIGCNRTLSIVPTEYLDFWMASDPISKLEWVKSVDHSETIGLLDFALPPALKDETNFKDYYWFNGYWEKDGRNVNPCARTLRINFSVTHPMIDLAFKMGARHIVFVGADCCLSDEGTIHAGSAETPNEKVVQHVGLHGKMYDTKMDLAKIRYITLYTSFFLTAGPHSAIGGNDMIQTYNASERGILCGDVMFDVGRGKEKTRIIRQVILEDIISEMNNLRKTQDLRNRWNIGG